MSIVGFYDLGNVLRVPDRNIKRSTKPIVTLMSFGDGYESRIAIGTNSNKESYSISFNNRPLDEIYEITRFLDERGSSKTFEFTVPDSNSSPPIKNLVVYAEDYTTKYFNEVIGSISVRLTVVTSPVADRPSALITTNLNMDEGDTLAVGITTTLIAPQTLFWTIANATLADFAAVDGTIAVTGTLQAGTGNFNITALADSVTEDTETYTVEIRQDSTSGPVLGTRLLTVNDTSRGAETTTIVVSNGGADLTLISIAEGVTATVFVDSTNSADTTLYWGVSGPGSPSTDFQAVSGSFSMPGSVFSRAGSFQLTASEVGRVVNNTDYTLSIRKDSVNGVVVDTASITITPASSIFFSDGAGQPISTYNFGQDEDAGSINVDSISVSPATYYWRIEGATVGVEFAAVEGTVTTTGTILSATGNFTVDPIADGATTFTEYTISLYSDSFRLNLEASTLISISPSGFESGISQFEGDNKYPGPFNPEPWSERDITQYTATGFQPIATDNKYPGLFTPEPNLININDRINYTVEVAQPSITNNKYPGSFNPEPWSERDITQYTATGSQPIATDNKYPGQFSPMLSLMTITRYGT